MYVIYDLVARDSSPIFEAKNDSVAHRMVLSSLKSQNIPPDDHRIVKIGTFDTETREIVALPKNAQILEIIGAYDASREIEL